MQDAETGVGSQGARLAKAQSASGDSCKTGACAQHSVCLSSYAEKKPTHAVSEETWCIAGLYSNAMHDATQSAHLGAYTSNTFEHVV